MTDSRPHLHHCQCAAPARRTFLLGTAAALAGAAVPVAWAQSRATGIRSLSGLVRVNGERASARTPVRAGDTILTGADGRVRFVVGSDAFFLRENSELQIGRAATDGLIDSLRMVTGALGAVFGRRNVSLLSLHTPTVTAGIRGTGCYTEVRDEGSYFCTCFGAIQLDSADGGPRELVVSSHHSPRRVMRDTASKTMMMVPASFGSHTDEEMDDLEQLVGRRAPWAR